MTRTELIRRRRELHRRIRETVTERRITAATRPLPDPPPKGETPAGT